MTCALVGENLTGTNPPAPVSDGRRFSVPASDVDAREVRRCGCGWSIFWLGDDVVEEEEEGPACPTGARGKAGIWGGSGEDAR